MFICIYGEKIYDSLSNNVHLPKHPYLCADKSTHAAPTSYT